ncbi:MAG: tetratricopeptide repeat protein [Vicinamibacterales bacterium]
MSRHLHGFAVALLCLFFTGLVAAPVSAQSRREMQMMADIRMLQEQTQQLQQQLQAAIAALSDSLKQLGTRLDEQSANTRKAFADQKLVTDTIGNDLRVIRQRVDESNVRITSLSQEVEALRLAIPSFPTGAVPSSDPTAPESPTGAAPMPQQPTSPAPMATGAPASGVSPQRLFDTAWADFTAGQWTLCIEGFNTYLKSFPRSDAADDAQFYIGECQLADNKFSAAMDSYSRVISTYPRGDKVPDAYYKRGLAFDRLGQPDRAKESWDTLIKTFPDSELAPLAKQQVDRLNRGRPPGAANK